MLLRLYQLAHGSAEVLKLNIETKPEVVQFRTKGGIGLIHLLALSDNAELLQILLERHPEQAKSVDQDGRTPLMTAMQHGCMWVGRLLLRYGANINQRDAVGRTAIWYACTTNVVRNVMMLIRHGADIMGRDSQNQTLLHFAVSRAPVKTINILLVRDVDPNAVHEVSGSTPLHTACKAKRWDSAKMLIRYGASLSIRDKKNRMPLDFATARVQRKLRL